MSYGDPSFVLGFFAIVVGIPVVCDALIKIVHGPKEHRRGKWQKKSQEEREKSTKDSEMLEEIYYGLSDLGKRVKNLETILYEQGDRNE